MISVGLHCFLSSYSTGFEAPAHHVALHSYLSSNFAQEVTRFVSYLQLIARNVTLRKNWLILEKVSIPFFYQPRAMSILLCYRGDGWSTQVIRPVKNTAFKPIEIYPCLLTSPAFPSTTSSFFSSSFSSRRSFTSRSSQHSILFLSCASIAAKHLALRSSNSLSPR